MWSPEGSLAGPAYCVCYLTEAESLRICPDELGFPVVYVQSSSRAIATLAYHIDRSRSRHIFVVAGCRQANGSTPGPGYCSALNVKRLRAWLRKLVSDSSTPAAKAPMVSLKPRRWVSSDAPVTVSRHSATNVSSLLDAATICARAPLHVGALSPSPSAHASGQSQHLARMLICRICRG